MRRLLVILSGGFAKAKALQKIRCAYPDASFTLVSWSAIHKEAYSTLEQFSIVYVSRKRLLFHLILNWISIIRGLNFDAVFILFGHGKVIGLRVPTFSFRIGRRWKGDYLAYKALITSPIIVPAIFISAAKWYLRRLTNPKKAAPRVIT